MKSESIQHTGRVISVCKSCVEVEIINKSMCAGCHAKSVCALGDSKEKVISVPCNNADFYSVGDEVTVYMQKSMGFKAVWISYVIPLIILLVFLLTLQGLGMNDLWSGLISIFAVAFYFLMVFLFRDRVDKVFEFKIAKN